MQESSHFARNQRLHIIKSYTGVLDRCHSQWEQDVATFPTLYWLTSGCELDPVFELGSLDPLYFLSTIIMACILQHKLWNSWTMCKSIAVLGSWVFLLKYPTAFVFLVYIHVLPLRQWFTNGVQLILLEVHTNCRPIPLKSPEVMLKFSVFDLQIHLLTLPLQCLRVVHRYLHHSGIFIYLV